MKSTKPPPQSKAKKKPLSKRAAAQQRAITLEKRRLRLAKAGKLSNPRTPQEIAAQAGRDAYETLFRPRESGRPARIRRLIKNIAKYFGRDKEWVVDLTQLALAHEELFVAIINITLFKSRLYMRGDPSYQGVQYPDGWDVFGDYLEIFFYKGDAAVLASVDLY